MAELGIPEKMKEDGAGLLPIDLAEFEAHWQPSFDAAPYGTLRDDFGTKPEIIALGIIKRMEYWK